MSKCAVECCSNDAVDDYIFCHGHLGTAGHESRADLIETTGDMAEHLGSIALSLESIAAQLKRLADAVEHPRAPSTADEAPEAAKCIMCAGTGYASKLHNTQCEHCKGMGWISI